MTIPERDEDETENHSLPVEETIEVGEADQIENEPTKEDEEIVEMEENEVERDFNLDSNGFYIIESGQCEIKNRFDENFTLLTLFKDNYFGENKFFRTTDFTYYGDIYASGDHPVKISFISNENLRRIPLYEQELLLERLKSHNRENFTQLNHLVGRRYGATVETLNKY